MLGKMNSKSKKFKGIIAVRVHTVYFITFPFMIY